MIPFIVIWVFITFERKFIYSFYLYAGNQKKFKNNVPVASHNSISYLFVGGGIQVGLSLFSMCFKRITDKS